MAILSGGRTQTFKEPGSRIKYFKEPGSGKAPPFPPTMTIQGMLTLQKQFKRPEQQYPPHIFYLQPGQGIDNKVVRMEGFPWLPRAPHHWTEKNKAGHRMDNSRYSCLWPF